MGSVAIIGAGEIGGATAYALAARDRVQRVLLVDASGGVAEGKALDITQTGPVEGFHARVEGTTDATRVAGCDVCVVADRSGRGKGEWQGEEALAMLRELVPYAGQAPFVFAGHDQAALLPLLARELQLARSRLIGSAPEALAAAVAAIVAMEAGCSPAEVRLTVLGAPPAGLMVPWSEASIGGYALDRVLSQAQLARLEARAERLWPPGPYTLGAAAAQICDAILSNARRSFAVLTILRGEFGVRNRVGTLPCTLAGGGIAGVRVPTLTPRERVQVETALGA